MWKAPGVLIVGLLIVQGCGALDEEGGFENVAATEAGLNAALNLSGIADSLHTSGIIDQTNPFFQQLGTNPRSCATCHSSAQGWTVNRETTALKFLLTQGQDPLFNLVDQGIRPDADVSTFAARVATFGPTSIDRGLTRFTRTINPAAEFSLIAVSDPYGFSDTTRFSGFRRPTPTANETKAPSFLWTGVGNPDVLTSVRGTVAGGARLHEQRDPANPVPPETSVAAGDFIFGVIFAQILDFRAGWLDAAGARGGPANLLAQPFYVGINDVNGNDPMGNPFNPNVFNIYDAWAPFAGVGDGGSVASARGAIYRGQQIFNVTARCSGCHNAPNVGSQSQVRFFNTGTAEPPKCSSALPLLTLQNKITLETKITCDPGRALNTGLWSDIGRFRAPPLRGLAARAPYFHDGQAKTLGDVVDHYNERFSLALSGAQKKDLEAFLRAL